AREGRPTRPGASAASGLYRMVFQVPHGHAVQEEVARPGRLWSGRRRSDGFGHLPESVLASELAREHRRTEGFEIGLPGQPVVEPFERLGRLEEQCRGVTPAAAAADNLGPAPGR